MNKYINMDLFYASSDIVHIISDFLNIEDLTRFRTVNRYIYEKVNEHIRSFALDLKEYAPWMASCMFKEQLQFGYVSLRPSQWYIRMKILKIEKGISFIQAPMSFGKTILGLSVAFTDDNCRYLIVCPPKVLRTWIEEAIKIFGDAVINAKYPELSPMLVIHSSYKSHKDYFYKNKLSGHNKVFLTTSRILDSIFRSNNSLITNMKIIVDEAVTGTFFRRYANIYRWVCGLSANSYIGNHKLEKHIITHSNYIPEKIPNIQPYYWKMDPISIEKNNYITNKEHKNVFTQRLNQYSEILDNIISDPKCGSKTVIYIPGGDIYKVYMPYIKSLIKSYDMKLYEHTTSKSQKDLFHNSMSRSVLVISNIQSEGINLYADSVCIIRPDWLSIMRLKQLVGRVLRTSNPNNNIKLHYIMPSGIPYLRTFYSDGLINTNFDVTDLHPPAPKLLYSVAAVLKCFGLKITDISSLDYAVCFYYDNNSVYNDWLKKTQNREILIRYVDSLRNDLY